MLLRQSNTRIVHFDIDPWWAQTLWLALQVLSQERQRSKTLLQSDRLGMDRPP